MTPGRLRLKHASGWFAAGQEVAQALTLLSDAAFKLFLLLCLHAERSRGALRMEPREMARTLGKTESEIAATLQDLFLKEICRPTADGCIEITHRFWPYQRAVNEPVTDSTSAYVNRVKQLMLERACVRSVFTAADQRLAFQLHRRGVSIQHVERAIHLACLRKYVVRWTPKSRPFFGSNKLWTAESEI